MKFPNWLSNSKIEDLQMQVDSYKRITDYWYGRAEKAERRLIELGEPVENRIASSTSSYSYPIGTIGTN